METIDRFVGLPLFQMEEGILLSAFLRDGVLGFQVRVLADGIKQWDNSLWRKPWSKFDVSEKGMRSKLAY